MSEKKTISAIKEPTKQRYDRVKRESKKRLEWDEITNDEFITMLLHVWEFHLEENVE